MKEPMMEKEMDDGEMEREAEYALQEILKAEKHKSNSKLMAKVKELAAKQKAHLGKLSDSSDEKPKSLKELRKKAAEMD